MLEEELEELGDRVSASSLEKLESNEKLKELLRNPHLRDYLQKLNHSDNPAKDMDKAMREPIFLELADECLRVVDPDRFQLNS